MFKVVHNKYGQSQSKDVGKITRVKVEFAILTSAKMNTLSEQLTGRSCALLKYKRLHISNSTTSHVIAKSTTLSIVPRLLYKNRCQFGVVHQTELLPH